MSATRWRITCQALGAEGFWVQVTPVAYPLSAHVKLVKP